MSGSKRLMLAPDDKEFKEVNRLVQKTWRTGMTWRDGDGKRLRHKAIQVTNIEKIVSSKRLKQYCEEKDLLESHCRLQGDCTPVDELERSSGPVWTTEGMKSNCVLRQNISSSINEHYLFHGTREDRASSIVQDGFSMVPSKDRSLLGPALYFAESSTKADMYADDKNKRTDGSKQMFLVRVALGEAFLRKSKSKRALTKPPCKDCLQEPCTRSCGSESYCHSVIGDCDQRPFRIFAVYKPSQCYPEYLITYRRLRKNEIVEEILEDDDDDDDDDDYDDDDDDNDDDYDDDDEEEDEEDGDDDYDFDYDYVHDSDEYDNVTYREGEQYWKGEYGY